MDCFSNFLILECLRKFSLIFIHMLKCSRALVGHDNLFKRKFLPAVKEGIASPEALVHVSAV